MVVYVVNSVDYIPRCCFVYFAGYLLMICCLLLCFVWFVICVCVRFFCCCIVLVVVLGGRVGFVVYLFTAGLVWLFVSVVCFTGWVFVELAVLLTLLLIGVLGFVLV